MILAVDNHAFLQRARALPPLPESAARLTGLLAGDEPDLPEIVKVIEHDPSLTMKLLRLANSAVSGSRHRIGTVREALIRLGTGTVVGFVIGTCVRPLMGNTIPGYGIAKKEYWSHSLAAAFAAEAIQAHSSNWSGHLAFTAALLHDLGKLVLGQFLNAELSAWLARAVTEGRLSAFRAEREILSLHHGEAGGIVAQYWGLPDSLVKGIVYHHDPEVGADGICYVTYLANLVAHRLAREKRDDRDTPPAQVDDDIGPALTWLGLAEKDYVNVCVQARKALQTIAGHME
jgi:HD-like signal output (HDOD) protein